MSAIKIFNCAELNLMIMKEFDKISDVYKFSLINRRLFENSEPILKICKKIVKYGKIFDDHQIQLLSLYSMFDDICSDRTELFRRVYCNCQILAKLSIIKKQNENEGRYFYECDNQRCSFFKWLDDEYKEIFDDFNLIDSSIYDDIYLDYAHTCYIRDLKKLICLNINFYISKLDKYFIKIFNLKMISLFNNLKSKTKNIQYCDWCHNYVNQWLDTKECCSVVCFNCFNGYSPPPLCDNCDSYYCLCI
ncbi:hypothetical protein F8M41_022363 [Gigaspora margarita]|uniref:GRF-type domain-containing protein n=1 Tax=Gigaspora margarita TaxID=4874 RepID=A0A8H4EI44_GIGMA|nr:hypothetical protein F8M41_022363 [Gigaspora margarita]